MHDIDRAMFELESEQFEDREQEAFGETSSGSFEWNEASETQEMEAAAQLLEANSEQELEQFLGDLVRSAASAARGFANSATGQAVTGVLKSAAKQVLPQVGQVIGNAIAPGLGGQLGQRAGSWLGGQLELEGLSAEDREFEAARAFVRFADETARIASSAPLSGPPAQLAQRAAVTAAQNVLPAVLPVLQNRPPGAARSTGRSSGPWVRTRRGIVVYGV